MSAIVDARTAIKTGDLDSLKRLLKADPSLAEDHSQDPERSQNPHTRTLLHTVADYPGGKPRALEMACALLEAGADVNARATVEGKPFRETPLHWAASNDDVDLAEFFLDNGAEIDSDQGVITNGTPVWNATVFSCVNVANLLIDRGASRNLMIVAGAGRRELLDEYFDGDGHPTTAAGMLPGWEEPRAPKKALDSAFGVACRNNQVTVAQRLLDRRADPNAENPQSETPYKQAADRKHRIVVDWLESRGIKS